MSEHYDFHYQPTGSGAISGQQVLQQTEDAINELGDYVNDNVGGAMDVAQEALETAQNAQNDAQTALDTANSFSSAIQSAQQDASTALSTAQTAQTTATNANNTAIQASQDASSAVTTANNASGQVSTLSGTVTALGQRVTTAEGNIGQNTSDITALTTRVGTAEGNITTLQNDVSIAQGNASSAMATAGTVKQQAFVFRYSSTALVASSTNSNTLLDNTDNLKVGDKVIDASGVIYSVTAIDSQNSTFTIGTSLIDLAQDSDVVHKSGDETIGGEKTFNDLHIISYGTQYKGSRNAYILPEFSAGYSGLAITTLSFAQTVKIGNYVLDSNNKPSLDASKGYVQFAVGENNNVNTCILEPRNSTSSSLGTSLNKWGGVYATNYYYGSNNVEFSTKFVTTDTAQTISGNKTFSKYITSDGSVAGDEFSSIASTNLWLMAKRDTEEVSGILFDSYRQNIAQGIGTHILGIGIKENSVRYEGCRFGWYWDNNLNGYTFDFKPTTQGANQAVKHNLGTSTDKWDTINGLEPSSLSLPSENLNDVIDISSYLVNLDGTLNTYTAPANGWISILINSCSGIQAYINGLWGHQVVRPSAGAVRFLMPILKNLTANIAISGGTIGNARFIPCQGNV